MSEEQLDMTEQVVCGGHTSVRHFLLLLCISAAAYFVA